MDGDDSFLTVPTATWAGHDFDVYSSPRDELISFCHAGGGVYIFAERTADDLLYATYIGQTKNLRHRLRYHKKWKEAVASGANEVHVLDMDRYPGRYAIEGTLIDTYGALLNVRRVPVW